MAKYKTLNNLICKHVVELCARSNARAVAYQLYNIKKDKSLEDDVYNKLLSVCYRVFPNLDYNVLHLDCDYCVIDCITRLWTKLRKRKEV